MDLPESDQLKSNRIPPLVLLTLLENAFKHGDIGTNENGYVSLKMVSYDSEMSIAIENSFGHRKEVPGIGLENVKTQLDILLGHTFTWSVNDNHPKYAITLQWKSNESE
jgi:LytS/YehU family sensor histidine kinase